MKTKRNIGLEILKGIREIKSWYCGKINLKATSIKQELHDEALEDVRMGRVIEGDIVHAWLESWGKDNELPAPIKKGK